MSGKPAAEPHCLCLIHSLRVGVRGLPAVPELPGPESAGLQGRPHETEDFRYVSKDASGQPWSSVNAALFPNDAGRATNSWVFLRGKDPAGRAWPHFRCKCVSFLLRG